MARLLRFLLGLASRKFYGQVKIAFKDGVPSFPIEVHETHHPTTLPEPDVTDPEYQKVLREAVSGVTLPV